MYLHALYPECDQENDEGGEHEGKGCPDELAEERLLWRDAEIRDEDGHLDGGRGQDE